MIEKKNIKPIIKHSLNSDLQKIAQVHRSAFPDHLSSALGVRFIIKCLEWYLTNPKHGFILHLEQHGKVLGYVTGFYNDGSLKHGSATTIAQYTFKTAIFSLLLKPWLIFHPEIMKKWNLIAKQFSLKLGGNKKVTTFSTTNSFIKNKSENICSLLSIGLNPNSQGKGYGSILIKAFENVAREKFKSNVFELSVLSANSKAIRSYRSNGWFIKHEKNGICVMAKY